MSSPITPELRSQILQSVKDGTPIEQAAEANKINHKTIRRWLREGSNNSRTSGTEISKARKEIEFLRSVILDLVLEYKTEERKG